MRSNSIPHVGMVVMLVLLGSVMSYASPAPSPHPHPAPHPAPSSESSSPFSISEYTVDNEGMWTDTEIPLSDASLEAIRQATPATPEDIEAWNAEAEPGMQVQAIMAELEEDETESQADTDADAETDADADADADAEPEVEPAAEAEAEPGNEQDISEPIHDDLEIAHGQHGRMLLIPRSPRVMMRRVIMLLKRLITNLKARSPLARITLKMKIEPVTTPTPTPTPTPPRFRRPPPSLGIRHRPRPVAVRLVPSRSELQTRRWLARCSMLLRAAVRRLHKMRQIMIRERMKERRVRGVGFPGRGVILFRSNNITSTGPAFSQTTLNRLEIEGEKNGTVTIIAPRINATLSHAIIVINRGTIVLLNRSRNNTFALDTPQHARGNYGRRFVLPIRRHHIMTADENQLQHAEA